MGPADRLRRGLGQAEEADLALGHQLGHRPDRLLDRSVRIDAVQVVEIDVIHPQSGQAALDGSTHIGGRSVDLQRGAVGVVADAELGRDESLVPPVGQRLADLDLVGVRAVHLGRIEEGDPQLQRAMDHRRSMALVRRRAVERRHPHAAQADGRNFWTVRSETTGLHGAVS